MNKDNQKCLITGATGFLGAYVFTVLARAGMFEKISCFVRKGSDAAVLAKKGAELKYGDMMEPESLEPALKGVDVLVNLTPMHLGVTPGVIAICKRAGVKRVIFIGNTQIFNYQDKELKSRILSAEDSITGSGLDYTILRPTMIYGTLRDRNMIRLIRFIDRYPLVLVPGDGTARLRPVHVRDAADAVLLALRSDNTSRKIYTISGKEPDTFNEMISMISNYLGVRRSIIHIPVSPVKALLSPFIFVPLISDLRGKINRMMEHKDFDHNEAREDFGYAPRSFDDGIREEVEAYQAARRSAL